MTEKLLLAMAQSDTAPIVICSLDGTIAYMNRAARERYRSDLTGRDIHEFHSPASNEKIDRVVGYFLSNKKSVRVYTYRNDAENKDVYMVALRNDEGELIGYYEKHEYRSREESALYHMPEDGES